MKSTTFRLDAPLSLWWTLKPLTREPTSRLMPFGYIRSMRTPEGVATVHISMRGEEVNASAWGPGETWAIEAVPGLVGALDRPSEFLPQDTRLRELARLRPGLRIGKTSRVFESLLLTIIDQKVTSRQARKSYRSLVWKFGEMAPGPFELYVCPSPEMIRDAPYWEFHKIGIEQRRAETLQRAAANAAWLEQITDMKPEDARKRLRAIPGIGAWTTEEVMRDALGDPDSVSVGDFHLPHLIAWILAGEPRGTDERMLELLEPYRGHRTRAVKLIESSGLREPAFGPRRETLSIGEI